MKAFRFFLDIDAENLDEAKEKLIDMAGDGGSFGDLDNIELIQEYDQLSYDEIKDLFGFKDKYDAYEKIVNHFTDYDAYLCRHCSSDVGNDAKDMISHLMKHTLEELKKTDDGDDFEENEE